MVVTWLSVGVCSGLGFVVCPAVDFLSLATIGVLKCGPCPAPALNQLVILIYIYCHQHYKISWDVENGDFSWERSRVGRCQLSNDLEMTTSLAWGSPRPK